MHPILSRWRVGRLEQQCIPRLSDLLLLLLLLPPPTQTAELPLPLVPSTELGLIESLRTGADYARPQRVYEVVNTVEYYRSQMSPGPYAAVRGLFIGVSHYANRTPLANAHRDAVELAAVMRRVCGLEQAIVLTNEQATASAVQRALLEVARASARNDLFVLHFAGHGLGLESKQGQSGFLLLHDAEPSAQLLRGGGRGVLDMRLLEKLVEEAGLKAKHALFLLDCCFSGIGARSRDPFGSPETSALEFRFAMPARYVIAAGGVGQPVLDGGGAGAATGHGLLTGQLIEFLSRSDHSGAKPVRFNGRDYLAMRDFYGRASATIPEIARQVLESQFDAWQRIRRTSPLRNGGMLDSILKPLASRDELLVYRQHPLEGYLSAGEGWVYLPVGTNATTTAAGPVTAAPQAGEAWASRVGIRLGSAEYGDVVGRLLRLLEQGEPSGATGQQVSFSAELRRRPRLTDGLLRRIAPADLPVPLRYEKLQRWREAHPGADWEPVAYADAQLSLNHEVELKLVNQGTTPLHFYILALDADGIVQWLAPRNDSWPDAGEVRMTHGESPLPPGGGTLRIPGRPPDYHGDDATVAAGLPFETGADLTLWLVASAVGWPEFERVLGAASRQGHALSRSLTGEKPLPTELPFGPEGPRGAWRGEGQLELAGATERDGGRVYVHAPARGVSVLTWRLRVLPSNVLVPILAGSMDEAARIVGDGAGEGQRGP